MIDLTLANAIMLYLAMTLVVLLGMWCLQHYRSKDKKIALPAKELMICEYCHFAYLGKISSSVTQCPQCHLFNKNNRYHR